MTLSQRDMKAATVPALTEDRVRSKAWLGLLGLATVTALAVFAAVRAAGADGVAGPVALVVLLLGAVSAALLYRADERAAVSENAATAADTDDRGPSQAVFLRAERDRIADLLDNLPVGCFSAAPDGRLIYVNETLAGWLGRDPTELADGTARLSEIVALASGGDGSEIDAARNIDNLEIELRNGGEALRAMLAQNIALIDDQPGHSRAAIWQVSEAVGQTQAAEASGDEFARLFEASPISVALIDWNGAIAKCNRSFRTMIGDAGDGLIGQPFINVIDPDDHNAVNAMLNTALAEPGSQPRVDVHMGHLSETVATVYANRMETNDGGDHAAGVMLHLVDATEQRNLELQFAQSQKMQAVGQLAGGIAHDFNNLLTAMMGFCDLLLMRHQAGDPSFADIMQIKQNSNRAAGLVRQLLAFSRRQTLQPKVLVLTDVLAELSNLLRRLIGENIKLEMTHARNLGLVRVDQGQIEQVIINLAVNARDAMATGGTLSIRTSNVTHDTSALRENELLEAGDYVLIEVSDTGTGIPKDLQAKIFEPFFSTKEVGEGTGLGLSTVYGIIKQTGGYVFVKSDPDEGALFSIYLPRHVQPAGEAAEAAPVEVKRAPAADLTGKGTILLVEDEDGVRVFGARALRNKGYTVLEANSGEAALAVMESYEDTIDLLISDVVMPQMDGATLIERVRESQPDFKVILISGYAEEALGERLNAASNINFLPKPFSLTQLASKVKDVIEA
jgi:two-component system, cell cycle sensor histidine kinase and response regulator CckA